MCKKSRKSWLIINPMYSCWPKQASKLCLIAYKALHGFQWWVLNSIFITCVGCVIKLLFPRPSGLGNHFKLGLNLQKKISPHYTDLFVATLYHKFYYSFDTILNFLCESRIITVSLETMKIVLLTTSIVKSDRRQKNLQRNKGFNILFSKYSVTVE